MNQSSLIHMNHIDLRRFLLLDLLEVESYIRFYLSLWTQYLQLQIHMDQVEPTLSSLDC